MANVFVLFIVFLVLKLAKVIDWAWYIVFLPLIFLAIVEVITYYGKVRK